MNFFTHIFFISISLAANADVIPVDACTFYESIWKNQFMKCAEPEIRRNSCTKTKGPCPLCIKYAGDNGSMFLPDYLIEVTRHYGKSIFSHISPPMKAHLELAKTYYDGKSGLGELGDLANNGVINNGFTSAEGVSNFWHVRTLVVPYGSAGLLYANVRPGGGPLPLCYSGISEFFFDQWILGISDAEFARTWLPVGLPLCLTDAGIISNELMLETANRVKQNGEDALSSIGLGDGISLPGLKQGCAYPVNGATGIAMNLIPNSDALSAAKLCMGSLGSLLPRRGLILTENRFRSAIQAAWKFSSLVSDFHPTSLAGVNSDDKWQLMYPKSTRNNCFKAGKISDFPPGPIELGRSPLTDLPPESDTYVFAIWKKRNTGCMEPKIESDLWRKSIDWQRKAYETVCKAVTWK